MKMCANAGPGGRGEGGNSSELVRPVIEHGRVKPELWNPSAAVGWSLVFTPVFGAWVHAMNWEALGDRRQAATSRAWAWASAVALLGAFAVMLAGPQDSAFHDTGRAVGVGLLVAWYLLCGKAQTDLVRRRYGGAYVHRSWRAPLFLGGLVYGTYVVGTNWLAALILRSAAASAASIAGA